jgi:hypothetical protein
MSTILSPPPRKNAAWGTVELHPNPKLKEGIVGKVGKSIGHGEYSHSGSSMSERHPGTSFPPIINTQKNGAANGPSARNSALSPHLSAAMPINNFLDRLESLQGYPPDAKQEQLARRFWHQLPTHLHSEPSVVQHLLTMFEQHTPKSFPSVVPGGPKDVPSGQASTDTSRISATESKGEEKSLAASEANASCEAPQQIISEEKEEQAVGKSEKLSSCKTLDKGQDASALYPVGAATAPRTRIRIEPLSTPSP